MGIRAAIFDMDGTLVSLGNRGSYALVFSGLFRDLLAEVTGRDFSGFGDRLLWEPVFMEHEKSAGMLNEWGVRDVLGFWSELARRDFRTRKGLVGGEIKAYPDALKLLGILESEGVSCGILSNAPMPIVKMVIGSLGLNRYFGTESVISFNYNSPLSKPSPWGINQLLARWNVAREGACIFGDASIDINAGLNAGILTAKLYRDGEYHHKGPEPHFEGKDLLELWRKANGEKEMQVREAGRLFQEV